GWEMFFWIIFLTWLAFAINGYQIVNILGFVYLFSWGCLIILTPIMISVWVNTALVTTGMHDAVLKIVPLKPSRILYPKLIAVLLTWLRFFLPLLLLFMTLAKFGFLNTPAVEITWLIILFSVVCLISWAALWSSWGLHCGSGHMGNTVAFMVLYYLIPAIFVIIIIGIYKLTGDRTNHPQLLLANIRILPPWFELTGIAGIFFWFLNMVQACRAWGRRK
ncbi:hypothetical protein KAU08_13100, partial [bacterium]|nr:hypothetical protein [bacterium]